MATRQKFALYLYTLPPAPAAIGEYSAFIENIRFTDNSPGGYGKFEAKLKLANANLLRPELTIFSRIALVDPSVPELHMCRFLGELTEPELGMNETDGEYVHLVGEGLGSTLRDDPRIINYTAKTAQQIVNQELSDRAAYLVIDPDNSQVFPDNPGTTYSPPFEGYTMEDVVSYMATLAGDYAWGVWAHPRNRDAMGFPTGQLFVHQRVPATPVVNYVAYDQDIAGWRITPNIGRAINAVQIGYNDPTQTVSVSTVSYKDPRLAANNSQGTAPFRYRKFYRNLAGVQTASKTQAQSLANAYGAQWQNPSFTTVVVLRRVRDANGNPIPLWQVNSDANIFLPSLTRRGAAFVKATTMATSPTLGVNLFYIRSKEYTEGVGGVRGGAETLTLQLDNFFDSAETALTRLQLQADQLARLGGVTTGQVQAQGAPFTGIAGNLVNPTTGTTAASAAASFAPVTLAQVPTSIGSFVAVHVSNANTPSASDITVYGFELNWLVPSTSAVSWGVWQYTTVGNCLVDLDEAAGTYAWHCPKCEAAHRAAHGCVEGCLVCREKATVRGQLIGEARVNPREDGVGLRVHRQHADPAQQAMHSHDDTPGHSSVVWDCSAPGCGYWESLNTALGPEDEDASVHGEHHAEQARLGRRLMRALGLPTRERVVA